MARRRTSEQFVGNRLRCTKERSRSPWAYGGYVDKHIDDNRNGNKYRRLALKEPDKEKAELLRLLADEADRGVSLKRGAAWPTFISAWQLRPFSRWHS
jgi:hypothetical protein